MHHPDCDVNDRNIEGIRKPCNCGASPSAATAPEQVQTPGVGSVAAGSDAAYSPEVLALVAELFAGRKGHGGAVAITRRVMWPNELRRALQKAYDAGRRQNNKITNAP